MVLRIGYDTSPVPILAGLASPQNRFWALPQRPGLNQAPMQPGASLPASNPASAAQNPNPFGPAPAGPAPIPPTRPPSTAGGPFINDPRAALQNPTTQQNMQAPPGFLQQLFGGGGNPQGMTALLDRAGGAGGGATRI
jgi:hypothetical protein